MSEEFADEISDHISLEPTMPERSFTYPRIHKRHYTRVASLQPAQDFREPLHIKLELLPLEDDPSLQIPFGALSYVWRGVAIGNVG
jgi:hypothetical protein